MEFVSEIYLNHSFVEKPAWQTLLRTLSDYAGYFKKWQILVTLDENHFHFFLKTSRPLPTTINALDDFLFQPAEPFDLPAANLTFPHFLKPTDTLLNFLNYSEIKKSSRLKYLVLSFEKLSKNLPVTTATFYLLENQSFKTFTLPLLDPANFLSIDFEHNRRFFYKKPPKYLDLKKVIPLLHPDKTHALLSVDTFPYLKGDFYLGHRDFNFAKHSVIVGSSGSGKSKFISSLIFRVANDPDLKQKYKFVVIDPHASLETEIGGLEHTRVVDFDINSLDLFESDAENLTANTELLLELLESLIAGNCSPNLIRVLRHSIRLLLTNKTFNFKTLRKLLLDLEYRTDLIEKLKHDLPPSVIDFFLSDFNNLKTKFYNEAISPIISFIDEMEMVPVFNSDETSENLKTTLENNFLTLFSLDRTKLGSAVTKTLAGLIMQQLLNLIQKRKLTEHIIFIIDEVAVVENSILPRYLSEARKYNLSLILASQYFSQISQNLKDAIFANTANYFTFRVSKLDAELLADNFNMKIPLDDTHDRKVSLLTGLKSRECVARLEHENELLPAFKATTLDFVSLPRRTETANHAKTSSANPARINDLKPPTFSLTCHTTLHEILIKNSTSRKRILK